jgi:autotransporter-associated beta strand protein
MQNAQRLARALLLSAALINVRPLMAANVYWDTAVAPNYQAGGGTWGTDSYWSTNGTTLSPWVSGDTAIFQGDATLGAYSIALSSSQTLAGLTLGSATTFGNWSFTGSGMSLGANSTFTVNAGSTASIANAISGAFSLTKAGTGTLTLSGVNTYTGTTTVSAGTLTVQAGGTLGGGDLSIDAGAYLFFNGTTTSSTVSGKVSGSGSLSKNGTAELIFSGDNSNYSGKVTLSGGTLTFKGGPSALGSGELQVTGNSWIKGYAGELVNNKVNITADQLYLDGTNMVFTNGITMEGGSNVRIYGGTVVLASDLRNTGSGKLTVDAGATLQLGNGGTSGTINGGLAFNQVNGNLSFKRSDDINYSGVLSGSSRLIQSGTGNLTISGVNTYTGWTSVTMGTMTVAAGAKLGTGELYVAAGARLVVNADMSLTAAATSLISGDTNISGKLSGSGAISKTGGESTFSGDNSNYSGKVTLSGGSLTFQAGPSALGSGDLEVNRTSWIKGYAGVLVNNKVNITAGQLYLDGTSMVFTNGITMGGSSNVRIFGGTTVLASDLSNTGSGKITVDRYSTLQLGNGGTKGTINGGFAFSQVDGNLAFNHSDDITYSGVLSGFARLTQAGTGNLTVTGVNTYSEMTLVSAGTLTLAVGGALGTGNLLVAGGAKFVALGNMTIADGKNVTIDGTSTISGKLSGGGALIKNGAGESVFSGDNNGYGGTVTLNAGTLTFTGGKSALGNGDLTITGNATILGDAGVLLNNKIFITGGTTFLGRDNLVLTKDVVLSGASDLVFSRGTVVLTANLRNSGTGAWRVASGGTLQLGNGGTSGTIEGGLAFDLSAGSLAFNRSDDITYSGILAGAGNLTQAGAGNLTLTGANTYTGTTTVSAGTLTVAAGGTLGRGDLSIATGANLVINGSSTVLSKLSGSGSISVDSAGELVFGGDTSGFSGLIELKRGLLSALSLGMGDITVTNSARIAGYAANDSGWANKILVNNGTLGVGKAGAKLKLTKEIVLSGSGSLSFEAGTTTLTGSLRNQGSGTWTIAAGAALRLGDGGTTGSVDGGFAFNLNTVGDLVFDRSDNINYSGSLSGTGGLAQAGAGILTLSGVNNYSGSTTVSAGTLKVDAGGTIGSGDLVLSGGRVIMDSLDVARLRASAGTFDGVLTGTAGLSKAGDGTLVLNGANTYTGGTTAQGGTIVANNNGAFGFGQVSLAGAALDVRNSVISNNISLNKLDTYTQLTGDGGKIAGIISGDGGFTKVGNGTLTLTGANTFVGGVLVSAGTLQVDGEVLGSMVVADGAKLAGAGLVHDVTVISGGSLNAGTVGSVGTIRAESLGLQSGAKIEVDIAKGSLGGVSSFDRFLVSGQLDLSAASTTGKCQLILAGLPAGFDRDGDYSFGLIKYGSLNLGSTTNIADLFTIDSSALKDQDGASFDASKFSLVDDAVNQQILLNYGSPNISAIPEPSSYGLGIGCLGLAIAAVRRRRRLVAS